MAYYISEAIHDENGRIGKGARRGDQTGTEVLIRKDWSFLNGRMYKYDGPNRYHVRNIMIQAAVFIANNKLVGYSQYDRHSLYNWLDSTEWSLEQLRKLDFPCSVDCSSMMAVCVNVGLGYRAMPASNFTGSEERNLLKIGFTRTSKKLPGTIKNAHNIVGLQHTGMIIGTSPKGTRYVKQYTVTSGRRLYEQKGKSGPEHAMIGGWIPAGSAVTYRHSKTARQVKVTYKGKTGWIWAITKGSKMINVKSYE